MARRPIATSLLFLLVVAIVPGSADAWDGRCGPRYGLRLSERGQEPYAPDAAEIARMMADFRRRAPLADPSRKAAPIEVPTWVHVVTSGRTGATDDAVRRQIATLNDAYGGKQGGADTGISFRLRGITRTDNPAWFRNPLGHEEALKRSLRRGGPETLNLYVAELGELVLGYATYPYQYPAAPVLDGVVIDWRTLPGGSMPNFDRGMTGVHEIGHWLGLLHTFENGCAEPGDHVDDTPPEAVATQGCPQNKDTCPAPGKDPVHNFMDYSHDRCMTHFTPGQATRLRQMWNAYRKPAST
ncbi:zinc metalloprotease [Thermopolyspora sp. NPDC052614]|uniref:zinc metalloprotease n=1 Tax=Thermopolyspora sp. NPDC052614 TaxID=3155682 RepID=UPI00342D9971